MNMKNKLVIRELREIASVPNGFDENILLQIQEGLAVDVLRQYKSDFLVLMQQQKSANTTPDIAERERNEFFASKLQTEYRNRAMNGGGFSLPLYVETAENYFRLEIGRQLQSIKDFIALGKVVVEQDPFMGTYQIRNANPAIRSLAGQVADGFNSINDSLDKLARVKMGAAKMVSDSLRKEMVDTMGRLNGDAFAESLITEATTLADAKRMLSKLDKEVPDYSVVRP